MSYVGSSRYEEIKKKVNSGTYSGAAKVNNNTVNSSTSTYKGSERYEAIKKKVNEQGYNSVVDDDYISSYMKDSEAFYKDADAAYRASGYMSTKSNYDLYRKKYSDLAIRKRNIEDYLDNAKMQEGFKSSEEFNRLYDYIKNDSSSMYDVVQQFGAKDAEMSKFSSQSEYLKAQKVAIYREKLETADTDKASKDLADIDARIAKLKQDRSTATSAYMENGGVYSKVAKEGGLNAEQAKKYNAWEHQDSAYDKQIKDLEKQRGEKSVYLNRAKNIQKATKLADEAKNSEDFKKFASMNGIAIDSNSEKSEMSNGEKFAHEFFVTAMDGDAEATAGASTYKTFGKISDESEYEKMTDEEIMVYNYYRNKGEIGKANEYLKSIEEDLAGRVASEWGESLKNHTALELAFGVAAGLDQYESGVRNLFNTKDDYIAPSAWQVASSIVREDLDDVGGKFLGNSVGQWGYDFVTTTSNMLPSILVTSALSAILPAAGVPLAVAGKATLAGNIVSGVGAATLGASAAGNAYAEMLNLGYNKGQARAYSTLVGASEAGLQYALGGIGKLGGKVSGNVITKASTKLASALDSSIGKIAVEYGTKFAGNMLSEGLEESLQDIIEPAFRMLVLDDENAYDDFKLSDALYSGILGALSAGLLEGGVTISEARQTVKVSNLIGEAMKTEGFTDKLTSLGQTFSADSVAYKIASKVNENTTSYEMLQLLDSVNATLSEQNKSDIVKSMVEQGVLQKDAKKAADVVAGYLAATGSINENVTAFLDLNKPLRKALYNEIIDPNATTYQKLMGRVSERNAILDTVDEVAKAKEKPSESKFLPKSAQNASEDVSEGKSIPETESASNGVTEANNDIPDRNIHITEFVESKDVDGKKIREAKIKLDNGKTVSVADAELSDSDINYISNVAFAGYDAETANEIIAFAKENNIAPSSARFAALDMEWRAGYYGSSIAISESPFSDSQIKAIRDIGKNSRERRDSGYSPDSIILVNKNKGKLVDDTDSGLDNAAFSDRQKSSVEVAKKLSSIVRNKTHIFESIEKDGKYILSKDLKDSKGNIIKRKGETAPNGFFDPNSGELFIDINAGEQGEGLVMYTLAHEYVHFIRHISPKAFNKLADVVISELENAGVNINERIDAEIAKAKRNGREISFDVAYEEFVADTLETQLTSNDTVYYLNKIYEADKNIFTHLKNKLREFYLAFKDMVKGYENLDKTHRTPYSAELEKLSRDALKRISAAYAEALKVAAGEYQNVDLKKTELKAEKNTADSGVKYQLRGYSEKQIQNWKSSNKIVICQGNSHLLKFVYDALAGKNIGKKMYFGTPNDLLVKRVFDKTGINIDRYNVSLAATEIRKIKKSHGDNKKEILRGQRAVTPNDYFNILDTVQNPTDINLSPETYGGKPVIVFVSDYSEKITVAAVVSDKHLDLFIQTAYIGNKKRNLATPTSEQADINTPEASSSTVSNNKIPQDNSVVNSNSMQNSENNAKELHSDRDSHYLDLAKDPEKNKAELQKMVDEAAKEAGYNSPLLYHGTNAFGFTKFDLSKMDDKTSIFLTSSNEIASTYSGVKGMNSINEAYTGNIDNLSSSEVVELLNINPQFDGFDLEYSLLDEKKRKALNEQIKDDRTVFAEQVDSAIETYPKDSEDYAMAMSMLQNINGILHKNNGNIGEHNLPTNIYILVHNTKALQGNDAVAKRLEENLRVQNSLNRILTVGKIADVDIDNLVLERGLDGYHIEINTIDEARNKLSENINRGNYGLYAKLGKCAEIDAKGQPWNDIRGWQSALEYSHKNTLVEKQGEFYVLVDKKSGQAISDGDIAINDFSTQMQLDGRLNKYLVDRANMFMRDKTSHLFTTRDISKYAKTNGYDSIIIKNLLDNGGRNSTVSMDTVADIYIVFDTNNVKSTDPVTYDDNGNVIPLSERFNESNNDIRYSERDSDGNALTEEQMNYFKDSKVRDENGNLMKVYHGSPAERFTIFKRNHNYFTDNKDVAKTYTNKENIYEGYLNITNPIIIDAGGEVWSKIAIENLSINGVDNVLEFLESYGSSVWKEKGKIRTSTADIVSAISDAIDDGELNADGIIIRNIYDEGSYGDTIGKHLGTDYVTFESNQFKNADNKNPTSDKDIRYSERNYWKPNLNNSEWDLLNYRLSQEIETSDNYLDSATKWLYNESKGTKVFAIYGIGDGTEPTVLYAVGGSSAQKYYNALMKYERGKSNENARHNRSRTTADRLFESLLNGRSEQSNDFSDLGNRSAEDENVRVLLQSQGSNSGADNSRSTEDSESGISFSERDNRISETVKAIKAENAKLKKGNANLKELLELQSQITHGKVFTRPSLEGIVGKLRSEFRSTKSDKELLVKELFRVYNYIADGEDVTIESIYDKADRAASMIFKGIKHEEALTEEAEGILNYIKGSRIYVDDSLKSEIAHQFGSYGELCKKLMGRVTLTSTDRSAIPFDSWWREVSENFPGVFDETVNAKDMPLELYDIIERMKSSKSFDSDWFEYEGEFIKQEIKGKIYDAYWDASTLVTVADRYQRKLTELKAIHKRQMDEIRTTHREKEATLKADSREKRKQAVSDARESIAKRNERDKLQKAVSDTIKWLTYPSKTEVPCPDILKEPFSDFLNTIDFSSKRKLNGGEETLKDIEIANKFDSLAYAIEKLQNSENDSGYLDLPENFIKELNDMAEGFKKLSDESIGDYVVNQMTSEEVKRIRQIVKTLKKSATDMSKLNNNARFANAEEMGRSTIKHSESLGNIKSSNAVRDFLLWKNATPYTAFRRMGEAGQSMFREFQDAQDKLAFLANTIFEFKERIYTDKEVKEWSEDTHTVKLSNGSEIKLTSADAMSIYCLAKRQQAQGHLFGGGVRIKGAINKRTKVQDADSVSTLTIEDVQAIVDSLTAKQKKVADAIQSFMSTVCAEWGNEISMKRFLTRMFTEQNYFPIESDDKVMNVRDPAHKNNDMLRLLNISATKPLTQGANNTVIIRNIFDVFANHASDMARLNAFAMPILDFMKWINYNERTEIAETGQIDTWGTRKALDAAFGKAAEDYLLQFIKDVNGSESSKEIGFVMSMTKKAKVASVAANLRVACLQVTAYPRARIVVSDKALLYALHKKPQIEKAKKYCGIALYKSFGFYDTDISKNVETQIRGGGSTLDKVVDASLKPAEWGDSITWGALWNACEYEVAREQPNLKYDSEEFNQAVGLKLRDVVYSSQVVDSTLTRSQNMRNKSGLSKIVTAFMSEPTLSFNMLMDAAWQTYERVKTTGSMKTALAKTGKVLMRAVSAYMITQAFAALAEGLFDAYRDDDDDEFEEKFKKAFGQNLILDMTILGKVPVFKDAVNMILSKLGVGFFNTDRMDMQYIAAISDTIDIWKDIISNGDDSKYSIYAGINKTSKALSNITGLPISNALREASSLWNNTFGAADNTLKLRNYKVSGEEERKELFDSIKLGNKDGVDRLKKQISSYDSAVTSAFRENETKIWEAAEARASGDIQKCVNIQKQLIAEYGKEYRDNIIKATNNDISKAESLAKEAKQAQTEGNNKAYKEAVEALRAKYSEDFVTNLVGEIEIDEEDDAKYVKMFKSDDFIAALKTNNISMANEIKDEYITASVADGKTKEQAEKAFKKTASEKIRDGVQSGDIPSYKASEYLEQFCDKESEDAEAQADFWKFKSQNENLKYSWKVETYSSYIEDAEPYGISEDVYDEYLMLKKACTGTDANGDGKTDSGSKKRAIMEAINSLQLTNAQKDALYYQNGWSKKDIGKAPWH